MMNSVQRHTTNFISEQLFEVKGIKFHFSTTDYSIKTNKEQVAILKPKGFIDFYENFLFNHDVKRVVEVGIFEGGMPVLLTALKEDLIYFGIDLKQEVKGLSNFLDNYKDLQSRISIHYNTSQDSETLPKLIQDFFGNQRIDLAIDDASHQYQYSRRSFELIFPLLKEGGKYIVEDWGWSHWRNVKVPENCQNSPTLSNLVFELTMACASEPMSIQKVEVYPSFVIVTKGSKQLSSNFRLDECIEFKGRNFHLM